MPRTAFSLGAQAAHEAWQLQADEYMMKRLLSAGAEGTTTGLDLAPRPKNVSVVLSRRF